MIKLRLETVSLHKMLPCPLIVTKKGSNYKASPIECELLFLCNLNEADTRLVLHAIQTNKNVVVVSKDTNVLT